MQPIHQPDDKGYKILLQNKKAFLQMLHTFLTADWIDQIDEQNLKLIDKSFILPSYRSQESDIVYQCRLKGKEVIFYVLLELQSTVDQQMPWRLLQYMVEIWRKLSGDVHSRSRSQLAYRLPPILPIVLYNGDERWTAQIQFKDYVANGDIFGDILLNFSYYLLDIKRWTPKDITQLRQLLPLALHLDNTNGTDELLNRLQETFQLIRQLDDDDSELLQRFIYRTLFMLADPNGFREFKTVFSKSVSDGKDGVDMVSNISKFMYKEMMAKWNDGVETGLNKGRSEGRTEERTAIAYSMLHEGLDLELISRTTGFTMEEIMCLKNQQQ